MENVNNDFSYPLQWMWESRMARQAYAFAMYRVDLALEGKSIKNLYKDEMQSNLKKIDESDQEKANKLKCLDIPDGKSYVLRKAIDNVSNQMASGVDTYEYQVNDPYRIINDDTEALLSAKCEQDYIENRLELFAPTFAHDLDCYGMTAVAVRYDQCKDKNIIERINPKNVWFDTMYSSTGRERFRGYSRMISWKELKKLIEREKDDINTELEVPDKSIFNKDGKPDKRIKVGKKTIKTLNDLDIYIEDMNKLAESPSLQAPFSEFWEYDHDLRSCYNLNWYKTFSTDPKAKTKSGYNGDDVELTVMYDLSRRMEFKIINRRFVISANKRAFRRKIAYKITNPVTQQQKVRIDDFSLECPLKFQFRDLETRDKFQFPISPVMRYLDVHDELCAWRAKRDHVSKILSILRIEANGADASSLKGLLNIMGVVLDDIQGDINTINFQYDYTAIDSQIEYLERTIVEGLCAYDQFYAMQNMGDRATAAESGMAIGAIAQGLATLQNSIMSLYADIARQCITNRVAYSPLQEFPINNHGDYSMVTIQQMALEAVVRVKSKLAKKVNEKTMATNALTLFGASKGTASKEVLSYLMTQALLGQMPRKLAENAIKEQGASDKEIAIAQQQAQNDAMALQQNQQAYEQNPIPYEVNNAQQKLTPDEMDQVIRGVGSEETNIQPVENPGLEQGVATNLEAQTPEFGSQMANPESF